MPYLNTDDGFPDHEKVDALSDGVTLHHGDCLDVLRSMPDASVDAVVTDPPYGLGFMGREWDSLPPGLPWAQECLRVLKPGGHLLAFGGTRTWHRLACAVEDAGFEVRDSLAWMYGSGFPKSLDVSKAIDKAAGAERSVVGEKRRPDGRTHGATYSANVSRQDGWQRPWRDDPELAALNGSITAPATPDAERWQGWGTALKPAFEPIVVARKPLAGTVAANVLTHGTGALNIDGCRVDMNGEVVTTSRNTALGVMNDDGWQPTPGAFTSHTAGRWPANVVLDESQAAALDEMSGESAGVAGGKRQVEGKVTFTVGEEINAKRFEGGDKDFGGASRFFYVARADVEAEPPREWKPCWRGECQRECYYPETCTEGRREAAAPRLPLDELGSRFTYVAKADSAERVRVNGTAHPTVKPLALMRWLVRLVTPPGGTVLEPFAGSGTTVEACLLEGFRCVAIEREADYLPLIVQRIHRRRDPVAAVKATGDDGGLFDLLGTETA